MEWCRTYLSQEVTQATFHTQNRSELSPNGGATRLLSDGVGQLSVWRSVELFIYLDSTVECLE